MVPPIDHSWTLDLEHWFNSRVPIIDKCAPEAPLSEWTRFDEYESLSDCKAGQDKAQDKTRENISAAEKVLRDVFPPEKKELQDAIDNAEKMKNDEQVHCALYPRCVASDDPRLKGN